MKKPWSISTTVRNSERIRDFLEVLKKLEGQEWTRDNQRKYQIMLIQYKVYGYGSQQFYNGLSQKHFQLMSTPDLISFNEAKEILDSKNYEGGGDMRGRQSFNPLEKMGLAFLDSENKCNIYYVRPKVCKIYPFVDFFLVVKPCLLGEDVLSIMIKSRRFTHNNGQRDDSHFQQLYSDRNILVYRSTLLILSL